MERLKGTNGKPVSAYADPNIDSLLKHSIRTQLETLLQAKVSVEQRIELLQKSFVDATCLVLSDTKVTHHQLVKAFETMYDQAVQSLVV